MKSKINNCYGSDMFAVYRKTIETDSAIETGTQEAAKTAEKQLENGMELKRKFTKKKWKFTNRLLPAGLDAVRGGLKNFTKWKLVYYRTTLFLFRTGNAAQS